MESTTVFSNVSYSRLEEDLVSNIHVFSVSNGPLPSYVRTLSPKSRQNSDIHELDEEDNKQPYCLANIRCLVLLMTFLVTSVLTIYIIGLNYWSTDLEFLNSNETKLLSMEFEPLEMNTNVTDAERSRTYHLPTFRSTPCVNKCIPYRARRFDSQCINGYCKCEGRFYQQHTCLPTVDGCVIERQTRSTFMDKLIVPSYTCQSSLGTNVHVISVYGNHFSENTVVNFKGYRVTNNLTVVLSSHYPVRWKLEFPENIDIRNIVLASDRNIRSRDVDIDWGSTKKTLPVIKRIRIPVGYGDDRHGMDTVKMLQKIQEIYGHVDRFTGTEFADYIDVEVA